jgi:hypothetical protein
VCGRSDDLERLFVPFLQVGRVCLRRHRIEVLRHFCRDCSRSRRELTSADILDRGVGRRDSGDESEIYQVCGRSIATFHTATEFLRGRSRTRVKSLEKSWRCLDIQGCGGGAQKKGGRRRYHLVYFGNVPHSDTCRGREEGFGKRSHGLARVDYGKPKWDSIFVSFLISPTGVEH